MLASSKVHLRTLDSPRESRLLSLRSLQLTQKIRVSKPLLIPLILILTILVIERENSEATLHSSRTLINPQLIIRTHHERMSRGKRKLILELILTLHGRRRRQLLKSITIDHLIRGLLHNAQSNTLQRSARPQQILTTIRHQQVMTTHMPIITKNPSKGSHDHRLTVRATTNEERHRRTAIIRLVASEGTANPILQPNPLINTESFQSLTPCRARRTGHIVDSRLLRHEVLRIMGHELAGAQVNDTIGRAQQVGVSVEIISVARHHLLEVHEDAASAMSPAEGPYFLHHSLVAYHHCGLLPRFCDHIDAVDSPTLINRPPYPFLRGVRHPPEALHIREAITQLSSHVRRYNTRAVSRFAQPRNIDVGDSFRGA